MADRKARSRAQDRASLTASAEIISDGSVPVNPQVILTQSIETQREAWNFYHTLGELNYAIGEWKANAMSRVRLVPAIANPGEDPTPIPDDDTSIAGKYLKQIIDELSWGIGGTASLMKSMSIHMNVPGESYLVGTDDPITGMREWKIYSNDEIKSQGGRRSGSNGGLASWVVNEARGVWKNLPAESMVARIWEPDGQFQYLAWSATQACLPICREIDMYNRFIITTLVSRLAMNGFLLIPAEVTFPVKPQFKDEPDPFVAELIDAASKAIKNPGSASAAIPIPLKVAKEHIEAFKHLTFDNGMGDKVIEKRDAALRRLAVGINVPAEVLTGMNDMNHWGQWQMEESNVKIFINPDAETIVNGLTRVYAYPLMAAAGISMKTPDGGRYVIWYDSSALIQQPDTSEKALNLFKEGVLTEEALIRESGFEPEDGYMGKEKTDERFKNAALKAIAMSRNPDGLQALAVLTGDDSLLPVAPEPAPEAPPAEGEPGGGPGQSPSPPAGGKPTVKGPPQTRPTGPPSPPGR